MKKLILLITMVLTNLVLVHAQTDTVMYVTDLPGDWHYICFNQYPTATIYAPDGCTSYQWLINDQPATGNPITLDGNVTEFYHCDFVGGNCGQYSFTIIFRRPAIPNDTYQEIWIHGGELAELRAVEDDSASMYNIHWNTGENENIIYKPGGTYIAEISDLCVTATRTFIVKDNVEVYRATVDLETNLNKTTWQVTEAQAEYISEVKVYRDGLLVGTAPYQDGYFLDAIGSDNAARNYHLVAVTTEGEDCPLASYQKGTIHTTYYQDVSNNLNMTWNIPYVEEGAQGTLTYFQICKYDPNTEELTVVDQVNASITDYTCGVNQFDGGYAVIAAVFNDGKGLEELSFSNLTTDILGIGENGGNVFRIYPNPAKDRVTIEGTGILTVTNALGQTILNKEINGKITIDLAQGLYFVKLNNTVRKIMVE